MDTIWTSGSLALTVADIDFLNPTLADQVGARERGVRLELRLLDTVEAGSVYASEAVHLAPAVCRIDLLESAPGAADRMHWHPTMSGGEPGERQFDAAIPADPSAWLRQRLDDVLGLLRRAEVADPQSYDADAAALAACADEVVARVERGLDRARQPWPEARHDHRGLAPVT